VYPVFGTWYLAVGSFGFTGYGKTSAAVEEGGFQPPVEARENVRLSAAVYLSIGRETSGEFNFDGWIVEYSNC
jgi:hypothetical protein